MNAVLIRPLPATRRCSYSPRMVPATATDTVAVAMPSPQSRKSGGEEWGRGEWEGGGGRGVCVGGWEWQRSRG